MGQESWCFHQGYSQVHASPQKNTAKAEIKSWNSSSGRPERPSCQPLQSSEWRNRSIGRELNDLPKDGEGSMTKTRSLDPYKWHPPSTQPNQNSEGQWWFSKSSHLVQSLKSSQWGWLFVKLIPRAFKITCSAWVLAAAVLAAPFMDIRKMESDTGLLSELRSTETKENGWHMIRWKILFRREITNPHVLQRPRSNAPMPS